MVIFSKWSELQQLEKLIAGMCHSDICTEQVVLLLGKWGSKWRHHIVVGRGACHFSVVGWVTRWHYKEGLQVWTTSTLLVGRATERGLIHARCRLLWTKVRLTSKAGAARYQIELLYVTHTR